MTGGKVPMISSHRGPRLERKPVRIWRQIFILLRSTYLTEHGIEFMRWCLPFADGIAEPHKALSTSASYKSYNLQSQDQLGSG